MLRVCHLGKFYPPAAGGIETHLRAIARGQAACGADVRVICVNHADPRGGDVTWRRLARTRTVEEHDGPVRVTRLGKRASLARLDVCPGLRTQLRGLNRATVDVLHLHVPNPTMLLALAATRPRVPLVITHHSDVVRQRVLGLVLRPFEHVVFGKAVRILSDSPTYPEGSSILQQYARKLGVLPLGIDLAPFLRPSTAALAHARHLQDEHGSPIWLAVGRLVYYKGLDIALAALARVPGRLVVIGTGPLDAALRARARDLRVTDRVAWYGHVDAQELIGAYHAATALWFPSNARSEGFGLVQVEAMASGCPVINTAIPASGVPWVSRHEETGLTIPMNDPEALASAARRLIGDRALRERLSVGARERVAAEFDDRTMAARSLAIYRQALAGERARP